MPVAFTYPLDVSTSELPYFLLQLDFSTDDTCCDGAALPILPSYSLTHEHGKNLCLHVYTNATENHHSESSECVVEKYCGTSGHVDASSARLIASVSGGPMCGSGRKRRRSSMTRQQHQLNSAEMSTKLCRALLKCADVGIVRIGAVESVHILRLAQAGDAPIDAEESADASQQDEKSSKDGINDTTTRVYRVVFRVHIFSVLEDVAYDLDSDAGFPDLLLLLRGRHRLSVSDSTKHHENNHLTPHIAPDATLDTARGPTYSSMYDAIDAILPVPVEESALHPRIRSLSIQRLKHNNSIAASQHSLDNTGSDALIQSIQPHQRQAVHYMLEKERASPVGQLRCADVGATIQSLNGGSLIPSPHIYNAHTNSASFVCALDYLLSVPQQDEAAVQRQMRVHDHPLWEPIDIFPGVRQCNTCAHFWNPCTGVVLRERCGSCILSQHEDERHRDAERKLVGASALDGGILGGFLADEPGLGKTLECIALILGHPHCASPFAASAVHAIGATCHGEVNPADAGRLTAAVSDAFSKDMKVSTKRFMELRAASPTKVWQSRATAVIVPSNIVGQWQAELSDWAPELVVFTVQRHHFNRHLTVSGPLSEREAGDWAALLLADVVLITYDLLKTFPWDAGHRALTELPVFPIRFHRVIFDEVQFLRLAKDVSRSASAHSRMANAMQLHSRFTWCVSGTPFSNPFDLRTGLILLRHATFGKDVWWNKVLKSSLEIEAAPGHHTSVQRFGTAFDLVHALLRRILWRNTKSILADAKQWSVPPVHHLAVTAQFTVLERELYNELQKQVNTVSDIDKRMHTLRLACVSFPGSEKRHASALHEAGLLHSVARNYSAFSINAEKYSRDFYRLLVDVAALLESFALAIPAATITHSDHNALLSLLGLDLQNKEPMDCLQLAAHCYDRGWSLSDNQVVARDTYTEEIAALSAWKAIDLACLSGRARVAERCGDPATVAKCKSTMRDNVIEAFLRSKLYLQLDVAITEAHTAFRRFQCPLSQWVRDERCISDSMRRLYSEVLARSSRVKFPPPAGGGQLRWQHEELRTVEVDASRVPSALMGCNDVIGLVSHSFQAKVAALIAELAPVREALDCLATQKFHEQYEYAIQVVSLGSASVKAAASKHRMVCQLRQLSPPESDSNIRPSLGMGGMPTPVVAHEQETLASIQSRIMGSCVRSPHGLAYHRRQRENAQHRLLSRHRNALEAAEWLQGAFGSALSWDFLRCLHVGSDLADAIQAFENVREFARMVSEVVAREQDIVATRRSMIEQMDSHIHTASNSVASGGSQLRILLRSAEVAAKSMAEATRKQSRWEALHRWAKKRFGTAPTAAEVSDDDDEGICTICKDQATQPTVTPCSHIFCTRCITWWLQKGEGHNGCPLCRAPLRPSDLLVLDDREYGQELDICALDRVMNIRTQRSAEMSAVTATVAGVPSSSAANAIPLQATHLSTKMAVVVKRLLSIAPADKAVVVSGWPAVLSTMRGLLDREGMRAVSLSGSPSERAAALQKFQSNPTTRFLLLNSQTDCSGLTLTCANHLLLVEPSIDLTTALQLPGRICRLGQAKPCHVYHFYIHDSVELNILQRVVAPSVCSDTASTLSVIPGMVDNPMISWKVEDLLS